MKIFNQNDYNTYSYASKAHKEATIASSGCGITAMAMVLWNLMGVIIDPPAMATFAIMNGARAPEGTDMNVLCRAVADKYGIKYKITNDESSLLAHLKAGGMAIANASGDRYGWKGILSSGGHYVVAAGAIGNLVTIIDPGYYKGKFDKSWRIGKVKVKPDTSLEIGIDVLAKDTQGSLTNYWLISKPDVNVASVPVPVMTNIKVQVGKQFFNGFLKDNHSFVPVRDVMGELGVAFTWDATTTSIVVNGKRVPVVIKDGKGYSLAAELIKAINHNIEWDGPNMTVKIE